MPAVARYFDPAGDRYGIPTFPYRLAPAGLATRDQLRERGLRPRGPIVAQLMWDSRKTPGQPRVAYLYDESLARPPAPRSPAQVASLEAAGRARRTCPDCGRTRDYYLSTKLQTCTDCADGLPAAA